MLYWIIIGIICIWYGICIKNIRSGTSFYLVWFVLGGLSWVLGACTCLNVWEKLPGVAGKILLLFVVAGVILFVFVEGCILSAFGKSEEKKLDYIIVLGAQVSRLGPSSVLKHRLERAVSYLEEHPDTKCIVSGGRGKNEPFSEAEGMASYLQEKGIPEKMILLEDRSMNTVENIRNSKMYFDREKDSVGIITNNFHLFRAVRIARKQGIVHVAGIAADSNPFYLPNNMLREFMGVVKDFLLKNL